MISSSSSSSWPSQAELDYVGKKVSDMSGTSIDHVKGGTVSAMTINKGVLLGFIASDHPQVLLRSGQFQGEVRFRVDEVHRSKHAPMTPDKFCGNDCATHLEQCEWGNYARGALYALQRTGKLLTQGITGFICGSEGLDSSGLSSSAAVGIAYLLALESANNIDVSPTENIELDRLIENEYLGLKNGILDQSAILLSSYGCLTCMNCKTKEHKLIHPPKLLKYGKTDELKEYKILLALSGLKQALTSNPGYNHRVAECHGAAKVLLESSGNRQMEPLLSNVNLETYEAHKGNLEENLAKRAEHYFSENMRVTKGFEAWACGNWEEFGKLISASGLSSIQNYECGCEPLIQLYEILLRTPGVFGARFSGAGFRGCCLAFVDSNYAVEAANFVKTEYHKVQPELASSLHPDTAVLICEAGDCARVI
ncbi:galacturonokinase [Ranunculus cassubicifolius]